MNAKAQRLLDSGALDRRGTAHVLSVRGDHGTYTVVIGPHVFLCTCPATASCSHIDAAVELVLATDEQAATYEAAITRRKAHDTQVADAAFAAIAAGSGV